MARALIRSIPIYLDGKKIAEVSDGTYDISSNDEIHFGADGYLGHSDGATTTKISTNCVIPVRGMQVTVENLLLSKKYFTMGIPVNGKFHQIDVRCLSAQYKWDAKTGSLMGAFSMEGGDPTLSGLG